MMRHQTVFDYLDNASQEEMDLVKSQEEFAPNPTSREEAFALYHDDFESAILVANQLPHQHPSTISLKKAETAEKLVYSLVNFLEHPTTQEVIANVFDESNPPLSKNWRIGISNALERATVQIFDAETFGDDNTKNAIAKIKNALQKSEYETVGGLIPQATQRISRLAQEVQNIYETQSKAQAEKWLPKILQEVMALQTNDLLPHERDSYWSVMLQLARFCADHQIEAPHYRLGVSAINHVAYPVGSEIPYEIERAIQHCLKVIPPSESAANALAELIAEQDNPSGVLAVGLAYSPSTPESVKQQLKGLPKLYVNGVESMELKKQLETL